MENKAYLTQEEYFDREKEAHYLHCEKLRNQTPEQKVDNNIRLTRTICEEFHIFERTIDYISNGSYGAGPFYLYHECMGNKRMNREAYLFQLAASLEFLVPQNEAIKVWKSFNDGTKKKLSDYLKMIIKEWPKTQEED